MRFLSLIFILSLNSILVLSQESFIYYQDGRLKMDTNLVVEKRVVRVFNLSEMGLLENIYSNLEYPNSSKFAVEGLVIVQVDINDENKISYKIIRYADQTLSNAAVKALETSIILDFFSNKKKPIRFYIPFMFQILDDSFYDDLKNNNSIVIRGAYGALKSYMVPINNKK
ncbi:MAG: hypothetical protein IPO21_04455 [Bacteroidales bacterium]|nr:hypothetical protein [Bacteroidales bacterium]